MRKQLDVLETAISWIADDYDSEWGGRRAHIDLDAIASALVSTLLPHLAEQAPSLEDVLDALAKELRRWDSAPKKPGGRRSGEKGPKMPAKHPWAEIAAEVLKAAEAATLLLEQCSILDYGLDDAVEEVTLLDELNEWRDTIHSVLVRVVDAYKETTTSS